MRYQELVDKWQSKALGAASEVAAAWAQAAQELGQLSPLLCEVCSPSGSLRGRPERPRPCRPLVPALPLPCRRAGGLPKA